MHFIIITSLKNPIIKYSQSHAFNSKLKNAYGSLKSRCGLILRFGCPILALEVSY